MEKIPYNSTLSKVGLLALFIIAKLCSVLTGYVILNVTNLDQHIVMVAVQLEYCAGILL